MKAKKVVGKTTSARVAKTISKATAKTKSTIKKGDKVKWTATPKRNEAFVCQGVVESLKESCFGGNKANKKMGASVFVTSKRYKEVYGTDKARAFVAVDKLIKL